MELVRNTPRQADLMIVAGRVSQKMAPVLRQIYDQMPDPKWVISMGVCASSGGIFNNYAIVQGVDHIVPVDIYLPGCPPRPEMLIDSILKLHDKIINTKLGKNRERQITDLEQAKLGIRPRHMRSPRRDGAVLRDGADEADRLRLLANCGRFRQKAAALQGGLGNAIANATSNRRTSRRRQERLREAGTRSGEPGRPRPGNAVRR